MHTRKITSLQHPLVKHFLKLQEKKRYRQEQQSTFVLGKRLLKTIEPTTELKRIVTLNEQNEFQAEEQLIVTPEILKKISNTPSPEPIGAEVALPKKQKIFGNFLLALDGISDPGNLGTLLRTAYAFGIEGVFLTENSADPFGDKAIRSAKGATFLLPIEQGTLDSLIALTKKIPTYIADLDGTPIKEKTSPALLILGNESHGPSPDLAAHGQKITIPMRKEIDSLNVAIAGAILLHQMRGQK